MNSRHYRELIERDAIMIDAIYSALYAMQVANGLPISLSAINSVLTFDFEIAQLERVLELMVGDQTENLPPPRRRRL